ncbi:MAG: DUF2147 domain-containing protein [Pseudomonadota bacterium]
MIARPHLRLRRVSAVTAAAVLVAGSAFAAASGPESIDGVWQTAPRDNGSYVSVRIAPCPADAEARCGTVIGTHGGARAEILGDPILEGMRFQGDGRWGGGEIIRPGRGDRYNSKLKLTEEGLEVRGCVAGGLFCGGTLWTRR